MTGLLFKNAISEHDEETLLWGIARAPQSLDETLYTSCGTMTPIQYCIFSGFTNGVVLLLEAGADPDSKLSQATSYRGLLAPSTYAFTSNYERLVPIFFYFGADLKKPESGNGHATQTLMTLKKYKIEAEYVRPSLRRITEILCLEKELKESLGANREDNAYVAKGGLVINLLLKQVEWELQYSTKKHLSYDARPVMEFYLKKALTYYEQVLPYLSQDYGTDDQGFTERIVPSHFAALRNMAHLSTRLISQELLCQYAEQYITSCMHVVMKKMSEGNTAEAFAVYNDAIAFLKEQHRFSKTFHAGQPYQDKTFSAYCLKTAIQFYTFLMDNLPESTNDDIKTLGANELPRSQLEVYVALAECCEEFGDQRSATDYAQKAEAIRESKRVILSAFTRARFLNGDPAAKNPTDGTELHCRAPGSVPEFRPGS